MKSVDPGIYERSECFSFLPSEMALEGNLIYATWCGHYYCSSRYFMERETYPDALLLYICNGTMDVRYQGTEYVVRTGDVVLLNCRNPHYYRARTGLEFLYLHFNGGSSHFLTDYLIENNKSPLFRTVENARIGRELMNSVAAHMRGTLFHPLQQEHWIRDLLHLLYKSIFEKEKGEDSPVEQAVHYISNHVGENVTLEDLSSLTGFSPCYFSHLFKHGTGYSPQEYIIHVRLEEAQIQLVHSKKSIADIACDVGYSSPNSFINIFKKKVGCSPLSYRKKFQGTSH